jgi:hypothetical protein
VPWREIVCAGTGCAIARIAAGSTALEIAIVPIRAIPKMPSSGCGY